MFTTKIASDCSIVIPYSPLSYVIQATPFFPMAITWREFFHYPYGGLQFRYYNVSHVNSFLTPRGFDLSVETYDFETIKLG